MKISALLIVKNEAPIVAKALDSVRGFDEIVVVDTGSTDGTQDICRGYTDTIHEFEWCDDFSAARNYAISKATGDWCYSIDADHVLLSPAPLVRKAAIEADRGGHKTALVYSGHAWREVLFKRDPEVRWVGKVHEYIVPPATYRTNLRRKCGYSDNHNADPERNLRILLTMEDSPRRRFYLGREYYDLNRYDEAVGSMRRYLKEPSWLPEIVDANLILARCYWHLQMGDDARAAALEALRQNPDCKEAMVLLSKYYHEPWRSKWAALAAHATNKDVLFVR
jgi:glycosyltransferase involved in cell wall biosynthesis